MLVNLKKKFLLALIDRLKLGNTHGQIIRLKIYFFPTEYVLTDAAS